MAHDESSGHIRKILVIQTEIIRLEAGPAAFSSRFAMLPRMNLHPRKRPNRRNELDSQGMSRTGIMMEFDRSGELRQNFRSAESHHEKSRYGIAKVNRSVLSVAPGD